MAGRRFRSTRSSRIHQFDWTRAFDFSTIAAADTKSLAFQIVPTGADLVVERIVGAVYISSDQSAASESQNVAFGAIITSQDAFTAGAASCPGPLSDDGADFMFWLPCQNVFRFDTAVGSSREGTRIPFESKARRRMPDDGGLTFIFETASFGAGVNLSVGVSVLTRLRGT